MSALTSAAVVTSAFFGAVVLLRPVSRGPFGRESGRLPHPQRPSSAKAVRDSLARGRAGGGMRGGPGEELQRASLLVAQISALLRAGRSQTQLWAQAAELHAHETRQASGPRSGQPRVVASQRPVGRLSGRRPRPSTWNEASSRVLASAAHAASFGLPVGAAIRAAAHVVGIDDPARRGDRAGSAATVWRSVAACIETAEASGSPLAAVLDRLAAQLEADADAAAARAVALAGPTATAKVLSVLPLAGLGLGMLMGADPLRLLLSTPLGAGCLVLGAGLTVLGRWWSARLVRAASEER